MDGVISKCPAGYDRALAGSVLRRQDAVEADPWANGRDAKADRPHAGAALASALADAGLVEPSSDHVGRAAIIDLALLKAITERPSLPSQIGRLIREYLGSLGQITSPLVPTSVLVNGTTEISTWRHEIGR